MALNVIFYNKQELTMNVTTDTPNLVQDGEFVKADCQKGQCIIYGSLEYNADGTDDQYQILQEGQGLVKLDFIPRSVRKVVTFGTEGVSLYEHNGYGGQYLVVPDYKLDIEFGVSSVIISGGNWQLYTKKNYHGLHTSKQAGKYPTLETMDFQNNTLKSIIQTVGPRDLDLVFYDKIGLTKNITMDTPNLKGEFVKASCQKGQCIIYAADHYDSYRDNRYLILQEGQGAVELQFIPRSVRMVVTFGTEGASLYEHNGYGGQYLIVPNHKLDIAFGVSSAIISGGCWGLYTKPSYQGSQAIREAGQYPTTDAMGFRNDKLKSIKKND